MLQNQTLPMLDSADINKKMGICPIMTTRYMIPFQAEIPGQIQRPGQATIGVQPIDGIVYCQMEKCQFWRDDYNGCAVHALMNLRTIADSIIPANGSAAENLPVIRKRKTGPKPDGPAGKALSEMTEEAPSTPSPAPGQADQV